jgi:hypothetical protein
MMTPISARTRTLLLAALWALTPSSRAYAAPPTVFSRVFAPSEGLVAPCERPYRAEMSLNGRYQFQSVPLPAGWKADQGNPPPLAAPVDGRYDKTPIKIPSPWNVNAFTRDDGGDFRCFPSYPAAWEKASMGWLRRSFTVPPAWHGRRLILHFEAVAGESVVLVNGKQVGSNFDSFLPFDCDITDAVRATGANELRVGVRKASLFDDTRTVGRRPYPAGSFWGQAIVGIWQDVTLEALPVTRIDDVLVRPDVAADTLSADVTLRNDSAAPRTYSVSGDVRLWSEPAAPNPLDAPEIRGSLGAAVLTRAPQAVTVPAGQTATVTLSEKVGGRLALWSPDTPHLYGLTLSAGFSGTTLDRKYTRFGWRQWTFAGNRQLLNGQPLELRGDSWHFMGIPQMTRRYAWAWFTALKAAHGNAVRLHAQPYPRLYLDMADEMGVCVLDETANWGSDGQHKYDTPAFWDRADDEVARLVRRDRNHASVFGWSVSNEVAWFIDHDKRPELFDRLKQGWRDWRDIVRRYDPTRPWISTDGDGDAEGIMPTAVVHYGGLDGFARGDKPYGEGESGGAYSDTPKTDARFIGPRAYESQAGRMEGVATEAYGLLAAQRRLKADYVSVFNLAWYGLQPLEIGLADTARPYRLTDGIFFGPYREGVAGVQPERLGPYCTTFNPGYDPRLPLYRPWPLFDAIQSALNPSGPAPSAWDHEQVKGKFDSLPRPASIRRVAALAGYGSLLPGQLNALGADVDINAGPGAGDLIVVDGTRPPALTTDAARQIRSRVEAGATCLIWGVAPGAPLAALNAILPRPVTLTGRQATSLLIKRADSLLAGMDNGDLYFTESQSDPVLRHGLTGPFTAAGGNTLVAAPAGDWKRWNFRPEPLKTAAILRSEREAKPAGPAMVAMPLGKGRYVVSALDTYDNAPELLGVFKRILRNAGVVLTERRLDSDAAFDAFGTLKQGLVCGSFAAPSAAEAYNIDAVGIGPALHPRAGTVSAGQVWTKRASGADGIFNFLNDGLPGPKRSAAVYLSFAIWSPRPLDNLLIAPNMPKLDLLIGSDDGCQVWLNDRRIEEDRGTHPLTPGGLRASLPLQRGWNQFVVKVVQGDGEWQFRADLRCSDPQFLTTLRTSISAPPVGEGAP